MKKLFPKIPKDGNFFQITYLGMMEIGNAVNSTQSLSKFFVLQTLIQHLKLPSNASHCAI